MSVETGRVARFVSAARAVLVLQLVAALLALGVAAWAFVEVRGLAMERDRLKARVAELEAQGGPMAPVDPVVPLGPDPGFNQILPPVPAPDMNLIVPPPPAPEADVAAPATPPAANKQEPDATEADPAGPVRRWDCSGANAQSPRCRPPTERPTIPLNNQEPRGPAAGPRETPGVNREGPGQA